MSRRVVITGIGLVTPLGYGNKSVWSQVLAGKCSEAFLFNHRLHNQETKGDDPVDEPQSVVTRVPQSPFGKSVRGSGSHTPRFIDFALTASDIAMQDAFDLDSESYSNSETEFYSMERAGVCIGTGGIGSLDDVLESNRKFEASFRKLSPYFVPNTLVNMAAGRVSMRYGFKGPLHSCATACAAGTHSVGDAFNFIRTGQADIMLAGGTDACLDNALAVAGFARMRALASSTALNHTELEQKRQAGDEASYTGHSRPFDESRNGFVMGEGAGVLVLELLENAIARGASNKIVAEICGYGLTGDANRSSLTSPNEDGDGAVRSMQMALRDAGLSANDVDYVNCHATSTPIGDEIEAKAISRLFQSQSKDASTSISSAGASSPSSLRPLMVSSTKGATGHLLGAAGAVETAFTAMALRDQMLPPTANLKAVDQNCCFVNGRIGKDKSDLYGATMDYRPIHHVHHSEQHVQDARRMGEKVNIAIKNSFGFGGTNATLVLRRWEGP